MTDWQLSQLANRRLGQYELRALIGKGGMSAVYRAYQPALAREVAIKVLQTDLATDADYQKRFTLEARTAAGLEHAHIVPVYDYGAAEGLIYIVMRLLTGGTLAQRLASASKLPRPLPSPADVADLLEALASALDYAHERGVIHRDIKPSNVMFDSRGAPYLVDFGIARILNANLELTVAGTTIGTPNYMAPEQWRDEPLTPAVDQYALGVLIYNALTGNLPFKATTSHALMHKHLNEAPPPLADYRADLPAGLMPVLTTALAKTPGARYPSITAFADAFRAACDGATAETDFFTFPVTADSTVDTPTPASRARVEAPGSYAQQVILAGQDEFTLPGSLPEDLAPVPTIDVTLPPLPEDSWLGRTVPSADESGPGWQPTVPAPASTPAPLRPAAQPHRAPWSQPLPAEPRKLHLGGAAQAVIWLILVLVLTLLLFIVGVRALNSRSQGEAPASPTAPAVVQIMPTATGLPTPLPLPAAVAITGTGERITTANAPRLQEAGILWNANPVPVRMVAVSRQGVIASAHGDGTVRLWRGAQGSAVVLSGHQGVVYTLAFNPEGTLLASAGEDATIRLWDPANGGLRAVLRGHNGLVRGLAFSPDGGTLASAGEDGTVRLWSMATNAQQRSIEVAQGSVLGVAFSPDGRTVASGDSASLVRLWDAGNGQARRSFRGHADSVRSVAFSPDGMSLASASTDDTIHLWDVASGTTSRILSGHGRDVWMAIFNPDGTLLASGGRDNTARVWNVATGQELAVLDGHGGWVLGVAFTPDGGTLVTGGGDGSVRVWRVAS